MKNKGKELKTEKVLLRLLWIAAILVAIKSIFTDFGIDGGYQIAMSYRHISGDKMFLEMWEPHQTSIFLNDILLFVYRLFVPSLTGAAIYIQVCGTLLFAGIGYCLYRALKEYIGDFYAGCAWMFFLIFRAKQIPTVEYANLEIAFSVVAFLLLIRFIKNEKKLFMLVLSALAVFFQVLAYPTCLISLIAVLVFLIVCSENKLKNCLVFTASLAAFGIGYALFFIIKIGPSLFVRVAKDILAADSHSSYRFGGYWTGFLIMISGVAVCAFVGTVVAFIVKKIKGNKVGENAEEQTPRFDAVSFGAAVAAGVFAFLEILMLAIQKKSNIDWMCSIYILPLILPLIGLFGLKKLSSDEKKIFIAGSLLSLSSFFATLILTNLGMITIVAYFVLAGIVSFIPIKKLFPGNRMFITLIIAALLLHRGIVIWGIGNTNGRVHMIWEAQNFIRKGPAAGVICDHFNKAYTDTNIEEFESQINSGDKIFVVGEDLLDSMVYVYSGCEISNYSTIDTPLYNESLEEYFEINPQKKPTLIVTASMFGSSSIAEDSYIMHWVSENYELVYDGSYWKYWR